MPPRYRLESTDLNGCLVLFASFLHMQLLCQSISGGAKRENANAEGKQIFARPSQMADQGGFGRELVFAGMSKGQAQLLCWLRYVLDEFAFKWSLKLLCRWRVGPHFFAHM